jgi:hypothetical protein
MAPITRSMTRAILAYPFTLHPLALRKLGVAIPDAEPVIVPQWSQRPQWVLPETPEWTDDYYSPTSPRRQD